LLKINILRSFDAILDCVASDNRLKVRGRKSGWANSALRRIGPHYQNQDNLLGPRTMGCSREEGAL
jgi:hypothetical protein